MNSPAKRWLYRLGIAAGSLLLLSVIAAGAIWFWYTHRSPPEVGCWNVHHGVSYQRKLLRGNRPIVAHVVTVDLGAEGIDVLVTPGDPKRKLPNDARTTSEFAEDFSVQVAINGDAFTPWRTGLFDAYPKDGDPVRPLGRAMSRGRSYVRGGDSDLTAYFARGVAAIGTRPPGTTHAISGLHTLVRDGRSLVTSRPHVLHPRTALGLSADGKTLYLVVIDGRQENYSEGMSLPELASFMLSLGADDALNLDGGGSSTLVISDAVQNSPIDNHIPGRQRPVANHLGIFAKQHRGRPRCD